jgi:two-component sensor histidine kinase
LPWVRPVADLARHRFGGGRGWVVALAVFAGTLVLKLALLRWLDASPFLTFYPAVVVTAFLCGSRRGAAVLLLSAVSALYFFIEPRNSFAINTTAAIQLGGFLTSGALLLLLTSATVQLVDRLEKALALQESLFHELQHRVANNLQIVASTLASARRRIADPAALDALDAASARVASLGRLHRRLYDPKTYQHGLEPVLRDVLAETFRDLPVSITLDLAWEEFSLSRMTALVLLVNEAAINAAKHVFGPARGTLFEVRLRGVEAGQLQLVVRDDGPGIAADPASAPEGHRQGVGIMQSLARELGGSLTYLEGPGTTLSVTFSSA